MTPRRREPLANILSSRADPPGSAADQRFDADSYEVAYRGIPHSHAAAQLQHTSADAADHSVGAARDVDLSADRGGVAAGVIDGDVSVGPTRSGPAACS
jgi:hypothetical protein